MEATTLDELKQIFEAKIAGLTRCMDLSSEGKIFRHNVQHVLPAGT